MILNKLVLIFLLGFISQIYSQSDCDVPQRVENLRIFSNATLSWEVSSDEPCEITAFQVEIVGDRGDSYRFRLGMSYVSLTFLEICEEWIFTVTPYSNSIVGYSRTITDYIPLPEDTDLSLSYFNATSIGGNEIQVQWDLNNRTYGDCTLHYRLSILDEDIGISRDYHVQGNSFHFSFLSPCIAYELSIRAVNRAHPTIEGPIQTTFFELPPEPQGAPRVNSIDIKATSFSMAWNLENGNRCPLKALHVYGGSYFNETVNLLNVDRPDIVPVEITSLTPNSMYYLTVTVENNGGESRPTPIAIQTLDLSPS